MVTVLYNEQNFKTPINVEGTCSIAVGTITYLTRNNVDKLPCRVFKSFGNARVLVTAEIGCGC